MGGVKTMKKIFAILTFWALAGMVSCSNEPEVVNPEEGVKTYELGIATDETRVEYNDGGEDGNTHKYRWEKGDELAVWYSATGAASYSAIEKPFVASIVETGKSVVFFTSATNHDQMTKGEKYDYIAMYPYPTSVNGTEVTYTIGTETAEGAYTQKKAYEADYQILRASGENLIAMTDGRPTLSEYKQMMTTLQFYVNSENSTKDYTDIQIKELQIYFPENVTGVLTIDAKTGEIKSATSDRVDVEMSSNVMSAHATRQAARQAADYANVVCKPFTLAANTGETDVTNRIVINVIGTAKKGANDVVISQSVFKTVTADKAFAAGDVIAMYLDVTNEWVEYNLTNIPSKTFASDGLFNDAETDSNTSLAGYYCYTDGTKVRLSNIHNGKNTGGFLNPTTPRQRTSSCFLMPLSLLNTNGYAYDPYSTLIIEFDAFAIYGDNDEYCQLLVSSTSDLSVGWFSEWTGNGTTTVQQVKLANANSSKPVHLAQDAALSWPTPADGEWVHYSVTLRDFTSGSYVVFNLNGSLTNSNEPYRACYLKNIKFVYEKK